MLRLVDNPTPLELPLFTSTVPAGFPSPADDHIEGKLDLNEHLVRRPAATFFVRASGESMRGAGIFDGDLLIIEGLSGIPCVVGHNG
ncbi:MAG: S24 family peptidase [Erythrobacter sp.]|uniref:LexA family protein n=1 Tax=Erythrobacter sp. TaxID=1042 RepID=UPI002B49563E|nr:S24 family peptidase [Erythrobacter sp.]WRH70759.1 MAG: S24 family peptidase [Erythrobacter sp.]